MKILNKDEAFAMPTDSLRKMGLAVVTTVDSVLILETPEELAVQSVKQPAPPADPVLDIIDEREFRQRLIRELAKRLGVTEAELKAALAR